MERLTKVEQLQDELRDPTAWSNQRLNEMLVEISAPQACFMKGEDCKYPTLDQTATFVTVLNNRFLYGCQNHMDTFVVIEGGLASFRLITFADWARGEKGRRHERDRLIAEHEQMFRDRIRRSIAFRDNIDLDLVTDEHIDGRLSKLSPEEIDKLHNLLYSQEEERQSLTPGTLRKQINGQILTVAPNTNNHTEPNGNHSGHNRVVRSSGTGSFRASPRFSEDRKQRHANR
jgi:hypothetical protein